MGLIYGNVVPLSEEAMLEQEFLNEMMFTKKDLQDPKTLEKIVKDKERYNKVTDFLLIMFIILGSIGSLAGALFINFLILPGGFTLIIFILAKTLDTISVAPARRFNKNSKKFEKKVNALLNKSKEHLEKDPKNRNKYQQIISNCEKVIKEIERRKKEARELEEKYEVDQLLLDYENFVNWCEEPFVLGHTGEFSSLSMFDFPKQLGIPESKLIEVLKEKGKYKDNWDIFYGSNFEYSYKAKKLFKDDQYVHVSSDDDYNVFYSKRHNKIFCTSADDAVKETSLYREAGNGEWTKEAILEADKESGYYIAARCPEQVKRKPFPIKL